MDTVMLMPVAQIALGGGWSILQILILIIVIAAVIGIVLVALRKFGVAIPDWAIQIFWIVVVAIFAIGAIKIVIGLL